MQLLKFIMLDWSLETRMMVFYILAGLEVGFVIFVFLSRYLTRHQDHDHGEEDDDE